MKSLAGTTVIYDSETQTGLIMRGWKTDSGSPTATANVFAVGAEITSIVSGITYRNVGTSASPSFQNSDEIITSELADGAVTPVKSAQLEAVTATTDGLTTGLISDTARHVTITSSVSTKIATLPTPVVGKVITGYEATNGFSLQTAASSNIKINGVDCDGTNTFVVPAGLLFRAICVSATEWIVELFSLGGVPAKAASVTTTADGLTTGLIPAGAKYVAITSANAGDQATLPAISAATIGQMIILNVGANGYELVTPASSNNTINNVDSDGTNQLDVAATTNLLCIQISATGWVAIQVAATTITVVAPDND